MEATGSSLNACCSRSPAPRDRSRPRLCDLLGGLCRDRGGMSKGVDLFGEFAKGEETMLLDDMEVEGLGKM